MGEEAEDDAASILELEVRSVDGCDVCSELISTYRDAAHKLAELNEYFGVGGSLARSIEDLRSALYEMGLKELRKAHERCSAARTGFLIHLHRHSIQTEP